MILTFQRTRGNKGRKGNSLFIHFKQHRKYNLTAIVLISFIILQLYNDSFAFHPDIYDQTRSFVYTNTISARCNMLQNQACLKKAKICSSYKQSQDRCTFEVKLVFDPSAKTFQNWTTNRILAILHILGTQSQGIINKKPRHLEIELSPVLRTSEIKN